VNGDSDQPTQRMPNQKLLEYHLENKLDLPQVFIDLFAKHLVAGSSLEPSLPLTIENICEELG
jgi:hypothetical protein